MRTLSALLCIACLCSGLKIQRPGDSCPKTVLINGKLHKSGITSHTIKYANAPRWEEAQLIDIPSSGAPLDASHDGKQCLQSYCMFCGWVIPDANKFSTLKKVYGHSMGEEDCLFLQVNTPDKKTVTEKYMPTVFHVHHGQGLYGYRIGHGEIKHVVPNGIAVVSANMRLGAMGTFAHPDVKQPNLQMSDLVTGLRWVKKYACVFGADPSRVTLTGSSSGGSTVAALLASPKAKGLFSGAWINSPVTLGSQNNGFFALSKEEYYSKHVQPCMKAAGCDTLQCLKEMSGDEVLNKFLVKEGHKHCSLSRHSDEVSKGTSDMPGYPIDGEYGVNMFEKGCTQDFASTHVPVVIGGTLNEMDNLKFNYKDLHGMMKTSYRRMAEELFPTQKNTQSCIASKLMAVQDSQSVAEDIGFRYGSYLFATKSSPKAGPRWHFTITAPSSISGRAWHTQAELLAWNASMDEASSQYAPISKEWMLKNASPELRDYFASNFQNFVRTGKPADPNWPETQLVEPGQMGGLPSNDMGNDSPVGTIKNEYYHDPSSVNALHSLNCKRTLPTQLESCKGGPADGGLTRDEEFKLFQMKMKANQGDMKSNWVTAKSMVHHLLKGTAFVAATDDDK